VDPRERDSRPDDRHGLHRRRPEDGHAWLATDTVKWGVEVEVGGVNEAKRLHGTASTITSGEDGDNSANIAETRARLPVLAAPCYNSD
jgi:hypothetical protein